MGKAAEPVVADKAAKEALKAADEAQKKFRDASQDAQSLQTMANRQKAENARRELVAKQGEAVRTAATARRMNSPSEREKQGKIYEKLQRELTAENAGKNPTEMKPKGPSGVQGSRGQ